MYWIILIILLPGIITYFLYFKSLEEKDLKRPQIIILSFLRYFILIFIGYLLLGPLLKIITKEIQKPIIILAQDNSSSMVLSKDSVFLHDSFPDKLELIKTRLSDKYDVRMIEFGDSVRDLSGSFIDKQSNFELLFQEFNTTYFNQNIGALIIASDGIYNKGANPVYDAQNLSFPIYTLPFGDTLPHADVDIQKADFNSVVYKGTNFPIRVGVSAKLLKGKQLTVDILNGKKVLASRKIEIDNNSFFKNIPFYITADSAGVFKYKINAKTNVSETNILNNSKTIYIEVEENKRKIVLLQNGYHPDVAVFKRIVDANPAFEIQIETPNNFKADKEDYALVILHQLPSQQYSMRQILPGLIQNEIPILFIIGQETSIKAFNSLKLQLNIDQKNNLFDEVLPYLNNDFNLFNRSIDNYFLSEMTPLVVPFGDYSNLMKSNILAYQQIGQIETKKPIWAFAESGRQKLGFIMGEGLWKWRLQEFKINRDHSITNELVIKTIQYLALKNRKDPFVLEYLKVVNENQEHIFNARLLNASNELVVGATINFNLMDENGNSFPYIFKESQDGYELNIGVQNKGHYKFKASTKFGNKQFEKQGEFIVKENLIEQTNLMADYNMLYKLSLNSDGKYLNKERINELVTEIESNTSISAIAYSQKVLKDLIHLKWLLMLFVIILTLEWFLRKYWGLI